MQGLGVHWELWSLASGGMTSLDVIRVGTLLGAEAIGLGKELGSLEPGKLADLQVLDGDPLADIKNTNTIRYVMKDGRLYEPLVGYCPTVRWARIPHSSPSNPLIGGLHAGPQPHDTRRAGRRPHCVRGRRSVL
jgi:hypothetical protein